MKIEQEIDIEIAQEISKSEISCVTRSAYPISQWFHWHDKYEICQIMKQPCNFLIDGTLVEASEGDIIVFKERCVHCFLPDKGDSYIRIFQFSPKILLNAGFPINPLKPHISYEELKNIPQLTKKINTLFEMLEQECADNPTDNNPFLQSLASSLYFLLMQNFAEEEPHNTITKEQREFFRIVKYINEHYLEYFNISTLSEKLFLSRGRLSSIFAKYSGITLNEYLNTLRIKNANQLLSQGYNVTEAAFASGFQSIRTFNNVYKKITGTTPSDYTSKHDSNKVLIQSNIHD